MEKKKTFRKESIRIVFTFVFLSMGTAESHRHRSIIYCDDNTSSDAVNIQTSTAIPVVPATLHAVPQSTACVRRTAAIEALNATESTSNITDPEIHPSPNNTDSTTPSQPPCLQGWAIFLLCLGAIMTVFLLAGIPMMVYCFLYCRVVEPHGCSQYNRKVYIPPEEHALQLK